MKDEFLSRKTCDRCGASLDGGRTMSRFDTSCLCMRCAEAERHHPDYQKAVEAEMAEIRRGNCNFRGIGWTPAKDGEEP
ncbi:MAG: gamma-glutamylcyclotransferase [Oligosphaeraceae bacterium]